MVYIPPKPKNDAEFLEVMAKIIFISGFRWSLVHSRWPRIRRSFHNFNVRKVADESIDNLLKMEGMIKNKAKISAIIQNAKICVDISRKHGSIKKWVSTIQKNNRKNPLFSPTVREEMRRFAKIGKTTSLWLAYVVTRDKKLLDGD